jgi:pimeloyl-ACP methyl ester carboxylesterase
MALVYDVQGSGPPVLLIQGVGVHGCGWNPQVEALSPRFRCLTWDNRGLGRNESAPGSISIEQYSQDALDLMDAEGWDSAHVVGHSMGGIVAQQLALLARTRVRSLSLLCTFARGADVTRLRPRMLWFGLRTRVGARRMRRRAFLEMMGAPEPTDELANRIGTLFGHDLADQPPVTSAQLAALGRCDLTERLHELNGIPTLVVGAENDVVVPPTLCLAIAKGIPGARYEEIPGQGHGVPILNPASVNDLLLRHLESYDS